MAQINVELWRSAGGGSDIEDFLQDGMPAHAKRALIRYLAMMEEHGFDSLLRTEMAEKIEDRLYSFRICSRGEQYRIFFTWKSYNSLLFLSGFKKKSMKMPSREVKKARGRLPNLN